MADLTLVIGNKNYSSWSLRAWLFLKQVGVPFQEVRVPLCTDRTRSQLANYSPSGLVPVLITNEGTIWDSLAICEYVAETYQQGWPQPSAIRAHARAVAAEMHSGFMALRSEMPMNCRARRTGVEPSAACQANIDRIVSVWQSCRQTYGEEGPWLFGEFSVADAMYAPVASRFVTYGVSLPQVAQDYIHTIFENPHMREWLQAGETESETIQASERGQPISG
ncbi:glutathione S-transferase family protein [Acaryochloris sp. CCMEE 5410]|uniref:glutathione S-transferase family protein n=1 Tax=Acaryochloris sp. CCMEE 5410 TaxID=310037 RepID=UPI0002484A79|nr:glutathione S-transferase family protein [Acaryochloris sp. CCMEE 5410]KAI9133185.1 glutathione S-transferase family protein [Acaryochloris sp. CCMEE 5410]